jgi:hypothetical protein
LLDESILGGIPVRGNKRRMLIASHVPGVLWMMVSPYVVREGLPIFTPRRLWKAVQSKSEMKVVVADDCTEMRRLIRSMLPTATEVIECHDGLSAIQAVWDHAPQWVLLDIIMATLDGISTAQHLHKVRPDVRTIL